MSPRLSCCVPGCRRTRGQRKGEPPIAEGEEWVCGPHWKAVPTILRRRKGSLSRRYTRLYGGASFWSFPAGSPKRIGALRLDRMRRAVWRICKRAAIERGVGIR